MLAGDPPVRGVPERREVVVAAQDHRERGLERSRVGARGVERRPPAEHGARREVLDLALAVDRRVGHDGDRLLEVVGEVLALWRQRRERPVVAERADRLGAVRRHLLAELDVVALPPEAGEDPVLHLHRLRRAGGRVAGDLGALERPTGLERAVPRRELGGPGAGEPALGDGALHLPVLVELRRAALAVDGDHVLLAGRERLRLGDHVVAADDARLGAEDVVLRRLHLPQGAQAERVGREHALVVVAGDQRDGPLGERPERLTQVHVERVEVLGQGADLVDDRGHDHLHGLGEGHAIDADQVVDDAAQVL